MISYPMVCLQIYTKISNLVGILANIGIGLMMMVTISALVITLNIWFVSNKKKEDDTEKDDEEEKDKKTEEMKVELRTARGRISILEEVRRKRKSLMI